MGLLNSKVLCIKEWSIEMQVQEVRWYAVHCVAIMTKLVSLASMSSCGAWLLLCIGQLSVDWLAVSIQSSSPCCIACSQL